MLIRVLMVIPGAESQALMRETLQAALTLVPHRLEVAWAATRSDLIQRLHAHRDDVVFLDWDIAAAETPDLVRDIVRFNPKMRTVVLLPLSLRQYRQTLWEAGACSSIPKEYLDQEWLSSVLCLIRRAMEREARYSSQKTEVSSQKTEVSSQRSVVSSQKTEVSSQRSEVIGQKMDLKQRLVVHPS